MKRLPLVIDNMPKEEQKTISFFIGRNLAESEVPLLLRKIKQVTQKKKEAVCQEEKELIRQWNFLLPNPNDSYSRKKFKNIAGMNHGN
jgi:hypothetical protein